MTRDTRCPLGSLPRQNQSMMLRFAAPCRLGRRRAEVFNPTIEWRRNRSHARCSHESLGVTRDLEARVRRELLHEVRHIVVVNEREADDISRHANRG